MAFVHRDDGTYKSVTGAAVSVIHDSSNKSHGTSADKLRENLLYMVRLVPDLRLDKLTRCYSELLSVLY